MLHSSEVVAYKELEQENKHFSLKIAFLKHWRSSEDNSIF